MTDHHFSRRTFIGTASALAAGAMLPASTAEAMPAPAVIRATESKFAAVASGNGIRAVNRAFELCSDGMDTLDAAVEGVKIVELDPADMSVGYGGLPNEDGVVQLDASCVHGPSKRAGAVAALEGIKTPSEIARLVLKYTPYVLMVGEGARKFALSYGYKEENLLTPEARDVWLRWRANRGHDDDWLDVPDDAKLTHRPTGTINLDVVNAKGELSSITTTSGLAFKIPGRVGDSPIVGAGQYCDNSVGAAGSTGLGELNIMTCGGFLTVEFMRQGMAPVDACIATLKRVMSMTPPRLLRPDGRPAYDLAFYAVNKRGDFGGGSLYPQQYAAHDGRAGALRDTAHLFERPA